MYGLTKAGSRTEPADRRQVDRLREHIGMVFQSFNLWTHMTENVIEAPVHVQKRNRAECIAEAEALLERVRYRRQAKLLSRAPLRGAATTGCYRSRARAAAQSDAVR